MTLNEKDPRRPKRIKKKAEDLVNFCDERHKHHASKAQEFGYSRDLFEGVASQIGNVPDNPLLVPAEDAIDKFQKFVQARERQAQQPPFDVSSGAYAVATSVTATASIVSMGDIQSAFPAFNLPEPPPFWESNQTDRYAEKLQKLDPELAKLWRSVWQFFYGGKDNPERSAFLCMRQLVDHFFELLAPDKEVRTSPYFQRKQGPNPNQVHRRERITYAARSHIPNQGLADALAAQADQLLDLYDNLNKLHKRGPLDRENARKLLIALQKILEQWLDALDLKT